MDEPVKETNSAKNLLYRGVFIGREAEIKQLQLAFAGAVSGQGALVMVMGEPGIGKTALCEQLAVHVSQHGGRSLVGYCYEEGSRSLPYLAFIEALRPYVLSCEVNRLRKELGAGASDLARIMPEIRERLKVKPRLYQDPEEGRYHLMQAVAAFLTNIASAQPLLIILEDLHDADKGTLDMLTHLSRHLSGTRFLIIGTYRDVEVDRSHPLSAALAELRRVSSYGRVLLRGLSIDEVNRMLESVASQHISWGLAQVVHRQTEGNPLFVQEVIRYLHEEELLHREGEREPSGSGARLAMSIPEGLRDVVGKRLSRLSKECNQLLSIASVIGREFALETLRTVACIQEDLFVDALKQAIQLSIIEEHSQLGEVIYRFSHAFFRQTLYEELIAPQRLQLHRKVAMALETRYDQHLEEHAAELAEHFSHSTDFADLQKAVNYGEMAAKRANDVYAYGEAVRLLDQAIKVQKVLNPDDKGKICDLLLSLCDALFDVPDTRRILETEAPAAFSLAESLGDGTRAARACISASFAISYEKGPPAWISSQYAEWTGRAYSYAKPDTSERAFANNLLGIAKIQKGEKQEARRLFTQAADIARHLDDKKALGHATIWLMGCLQAPHDTEEIKRLAEELWRSPRAGLRSITASIFSSFGLLGIITAVLTFGQRQWAEEACDELRASAQRSGNIHLVIESAAVDGILATMDGRLEEAVHIAESIRVRGEEAGILGIARMYEYWAGFKARLYLGTSLEALEHELRELLPEKVPPTTVQFCLVLAHLGKEEEASEILENYVERRPGIGNAEDETPAFWDSAFLESAVLINHYKTAELLLKRLNVPNLYTPGVNLSTCIPRHLGGAAALLGRYEEARTHYQEAIRVCTEMPFCPELALTHVQLAELLLEHYPEEKKEALEHLDIAAKEFREMKMQPSLEKALKIAADKGLHLDSSLPASAVPGVSTHRPAEPLVITPAEKEIVKAEESLQMAKAEQLSPRELEILRLVVAGLTNRQIAERLFVSLGTVKAHVHNIFEKLHARTRTQAVSLAREFKLV